MEAWIGEAEAGTHNLARALKSYEAAAAGWWTMNSATMMRAIRRWFRLKIGKTLVRMGKVREVATHFGRALDTAKVPVSLEHNDFPALENAAAEAHAGEGDLAELEARNAANEACSIETEEVTPARPMKRVSQHLEAHFEPCSNQRKWLPVSRNPEQIAQQLASCKAGLAP